MAIELIDVKCPSGITGLVRPITVRDINSLASKKAKRSNHDIMGRFLSGVWTKTIDVGPYSGLESVEIGKGISDWSNMLLGDRAFLIIESRRLTWGDDFFFVVGCRSCGKRIEWKVDLSELEHSGLSQEASDIISNNGLDAAISRVLPKSNSNIEFRLLRGFHQKMVSEAMEKGEGDGQIAGLLCRLAKIDGIESPRARRKFVEDMHIVDVEYLRDEWEEADICIQDQIEIECPRCSFIHEVSLPIDERFFSAKSAKRRKR